jgi:uncharacterized protein
MTGRVAAASALALVVASGVVGCGGGSPSSSSTATSTLRGSAGSVQGLVSVRQITYVSPTGGSVAALVAVPRTNERRGCLIWEFGYGSTKQSSAAVWQGAATLGLATLSIDFHRDGRALTAAGQKTAMQDPAALATLVRETVSDLRGAVAYLHRQPYCRGNVAYAGMSLGGIVGTLLAATDDGVDAAVIMSTPGTFRSVVGGDVALPGIRSHPDRLAAALELLSPLDPDRFVGRIAPRPVLILSGTKDAVVPHASELALEAAARAPKVVVNYDGGHNPLTGAAAAKHANAIGSFLLRYVVEPTFGISGRADGTYTQRSGSWATAPARPSG